MAGRVIQGFFSSGQAKSLSPTLLPRGFAHKPGAAASGLSGRAPVAQPFGNTGTFQVDPAQLGLVSGGGRALPDTLRSKMEAAFGTDFSAVRVHVGPQAERIGALAFTTGTDIYFAPGRYQPESMQGHQLIGHELAHVIQQKQGRVRSTGGGVSVVQDRMLEAEADGMGHRAANQVTPVALQAKPAVPSPFSAERRDPSGQLQLQTALHGSRAVQKKGGKLLQGLATPRVFPGPEVQIQSEIVAELEEINKTGKGMFGSITAVACLGAVELPAVLPADINRLIAAATFIKAPNPSVIDRYAFVEDNDLLQQKIIRLTIRTMEQAGQIEYLRASGLTGGDYRILVEVHYYRERPPSQQGMHKDTLGQTLFVNLNYVTDGPIVGPEYIVNPSAVAEHDSKTAGTLPAKFRRHIAKAQRDLPEPTTIGATIIPANGVVSFVDELIHHTTPLLEHRKVSVQNVATYLKATYRRQYDEAETAYQEFQKSGRVYSMAAWVGSWTWSFFSTPAADKLKWYGYMSLIHSGVAQVDRPRLTMVGLSKLDIDNIVDNYPGPRSTDTRFPFRNVSIPKSSVAHIPSRAPLTRRMSVSDFRRQLPAPLTGNRRFFRTWVRAVPR